MSADPAHITPHLSFHRTRHLNAEQLAIGRLEARRLPRGWFSPRRIENEDSVAGFVEHHLLLEQVRDQSSETSCCAAAGLRHRHRIELHPSRWSLRLLMLCPVLPAFQSSLLSCTQRLPAPLYALEGEPYMR